MLNRTFILSAAVLASSVVIAIVLALLLTGESPGASQEVTAAVAIDQSDGLPAEGIHVSGHWTLNVFDTDGSQVSHNEFDNALTTQGAQRLVRYFARLDTPGLWEVWLREGTDPGVTGPCGATTADPPPASQCYVVEPNSLRNGVSLTKNLTVSLVDSPSSLINSVLRLEGSFTAAVDGQIDHVQTRHGRCPETNSPDNCIATDITWPITETAITPVAIPDGQTVQVIVDISFS